MQISKFHQPDLIDFMLTQFPDEIPTLDNMFDDSAATMARVVKDEEEFLPDTDSENPEVISRQIETLSQHFLQ